MAKKKIIIAGGGMAGLLTAIDLTRRGVSCVVVEKKEYPFHRVCGEYISNEVVPYLKTLDVYPRELGPSTITRFQLSSTNGSAVTMRLDLGGFGISRFVFDNFLYRHAISLGVAFELRQDIDAIAFSNDQFTVKISNKTLHADLVIGAFGKRSRIDSQLERSFIQKRSPYVGVKYHIRQKEFPHDLIALHNFQDGYCGISRVENETINLCYLTHRDNIKAYGNLRSMEQGVLFKNPYLKKIFQSAEFLFDRPETINEISFETKEPVYEHILMAGDAAGMITPLCGNGMAIAIHSAKLLSERVHRFCIDSSYSRQALEDDYTKSWRQHFATRLWVGRQIQQLFGDTWKSNTAVNLARYFPPIAHYLVKKTHGKPFDIARSLSVP
jgi:flavin-dependent dehydrogenase